MASPESLTKVSQIVSNIYALLRGNGYVLIDENGDVQIQPDIGRKAYLDGSELVNVDYIQSVDGVLEKQENLADLDNPSDARNNLGLGNSATKDTQTTPYDISVADAVLKIGSWGIGTAGIGDSGVTTTSNANTLTNTGIYYTNVAFTGQPAGTSNIGALLHISQLPNANSTLRVWTQMFFDINGSKIFWRVKPAGTAITAATWVQIYPIDATTLDGEDGAAYLLASRTFTEFNALPSPDASKLAARNELLNGSGLGEKAKQVDGLSARFFGGKSQVGTQYALNLASGFYYASTINNSVGGVGPENDVANILGLPAGSNWFVINMLGPITGAYSARQIWTNAVNGDIYDRVLTTASADWVTTKQNPTSPGGDCRLTLSVGNLKLSPYNGNKINIGGFYRTIPASGTNLSPLGTLASTTYYIYAFMTGSTITLEYSTTGYTVSSTLGIPVKTGDANKTLVGMARSGAVDTWYIVRSYYNDPGFFNKTALTANSAATPEVSTQLRTEFLVWSDETVHMCCDGAVQTALGAVDLKLGIDGTVAEDVWNHMGRGSGDGSGQRTPFSLTHFKQNFSEGYHYVTLLKASSEGTVFGSATTGSRTTMKVHIGRR